MTDTNTPTPTPHPSTTAAPPATPPATTTPAQTTVDSIFSAFEAGVTKAEAASAAAASPPQNTLVPVGGDVAMTSASETPATSATSATLGTPPASAFTFSKEDLAREIAQASRDTEDRLMRQFEERQREMQRQFEEQRDRDQVLADYKQYLATASPDHREMAEAATCGGESVKTLPVAAARELVHRFQACSAKRARAPVGSTPAPPTYIPPYSSDVTRQVAIHQRQQTQTQIGSTPVANRAPARHRGPVGATVSVLDCYSTGRELADSEVGQREHVPPPRTAQAYNRQFNAAHPRPGFKYSARSREPPPPFAPSTSFSL